jgi:hypothetical protein
MYVTGKTLQDFGEDYSYGIGCVYSGTFPYPEYFANYAGTASIIDVQSDINMIVP